MCIRQYRPYQTNNDKHNIHKHKSVGNHCSGRTNKYEMQYMIKYNDIDHKGDKSIWPVVAVAVVVFVVDSTKYTQT